VPDAMHPPCGKRLAVIPAIRPEAAQDPNPAEPEPYRSKNGVLVRLVREL